MKINEIYSRLQPGALDSKTLHVERTGSDRNTTQAAASGSRRDQINLSSLSRQAHHYLEIVKGLPDIRLSKVEDLKRAYQNGEYVVDAERLASKIVGGGDDMDLIL